MKRGSYRTRGIILQHGPERILGRQGCCPGVDGACYLALRHWRGFQVTASSSPEACRANTGRSATRTSGPTPGEGTGGLRRWAPAGETGPSEAAGCFNEMQQVLHHYPAGAHQISVANENHIGLIFIMRFREGKQRVLVKTVFAFPEKK